MVIKSYMIDNPTSKGKYGRIQTFHSTLRTRVVHTEAVLYNILASIENQSHILLFAKSGDSKVHHETNLLSIHKLYCVINGLGIRGQLPRCVINEHQV